ncbi:diguanylate cyclase [Salinivibrio kushneri]|nr:diguanylate cyclase [Salinivibrio kushneri]
MLENVSINKKLPSVMIFFALISMIVAGVVSYINIKVNVENIIKNNMLSLLQSRKSSLTNYFSSLEDEMLFHGQSPLVRDALGKFSQSFDDIPNNRERYLKNIYIRDNPFSSGQRDHFLSPDDGSVYSEKHQYYHPIFLNLVRSNTYYDMFLVDTDGHLVYTVKKDEDYATNLIHGPWKDSSLSKLFSKINNERKPGEVYYSDIDFYEPNNNMPSSFIGIPVFDRNVNYMGALIFQLPIEPINKIMQVTAGMGATGESYLVGSDFLMRSDSRFLEHNNILKTRVDTVPSRDGLQGSSGKGLFTDYRGRRVYSAYAPISFKGVEWVMIAEVDQDEVFQPVSEMSQIFLFTNLIVFVFVVFSGYLLGVSISNPIRTMTSTMLRLAKNDLSTNVYISKREDEIGQMAKALVVFKNNAEKREELKSQLEHLANHDNLTGLATRDFAMKKLEVITQASKEKGNYVSVVFVDLDNFKKVNDSFGHQTGDRLLCDVAKTLTESVRQTDVVARIGGDEFLLLLANMPDYNAIKLLVDEVMSSVRMTLSHSDKFSFVSLSVGVSIFPNDDNSINGLVAKADKAMYRAKSNGKNHYCFWNEQDDIDE